MKEFYEKIWRLAKPYYEKARPMDVDHIEWMMQDAMLVCEKEKIDHSLLLPLVILHDVGYAKIPKDDYFKTSMRKAHMKAGTAIAQKILAEIKYPPKKAKKIVYYVSVHDNWALDDDSVYKDLILAAFDDLDYIWTVTPKGFFITAKFLGKNSKETLKWIETNEKLTRRPFSTKTTKKLYEKYLKDRESEVLK